MSRGRAIIAALIFSVALVLVVWKLVLHHAPSGHRVLAEFKDVGLLVPGDDARIDGTTVGTVATIRLTDRGTAMVTIALRPGIEPLDTDATASVRDQDLLGDTYLELEPGDSRQPLRGPIPTSHTFIATRVQDLFNTFTAPTRTALQELIVQLGTAIDDQGLDLNKAAVQLAPAFEALGSVTSQLSSQNAEVGTTITSLEQVGAQVAPRTDELKDLIGGFDRTVQIASTRSRELSAGIAGAPQTLAGLQRSLTSLDDTASELRPLAQDLGGVAPILTTALKRVPTFARNATPALRELDGLVDRTRTALVAGRRSLPRLSSALTTVATVASPIRAFAKMINPYVTYLIKGVFGGLGGLAAEPGTQAFSDQPGRNYFRGEAVLGCETFGVPTAPGCMTKLLTSLTAASVPAASSRTKASPATKPSRDGATTTSATTTPAAPTSTATVPSLAHALAPVRRTVHHVVQGVATTATQSSTTLTKLLGFLLGR